MRRLYMMIGAQGSGKTTWSKDFISNNPNAKRISQDDMGKDGHWNNYKKYIRDGEPIIVIDRINHNKAQRAKYVSLAKSSNYIIHFVWLKTPMDVCLGRMKTRKNHPTIKENDDHKKILSWFFSAFEEPTDNECDFMEVIE